MMRLAEKICVVTGGAQGIGRAAAERFLSEGASVAILDIDAGKGEPAREALAANGGDVSFHRADVSDEAEVAAAFEQVLANYGRIDVLLNNAGVYPIRRWEDMTVDDFDRVIAINLRSVFLCSKAAYTPMKRAGAGSIVNVASALFFASSPGLAHYIASKGGVVGLTRAMAVELGDAGIRVNAIAPGLVLTETVLGDRPVEEADRSIDQRALKRRSYPEDLLGTLVYLASSDSEFVTGQTIVIDGGRALH